MFVQWILKEEKPLHAFFFFSKSGLRRSKKLWLPFSSTLVNRDSSSKWSPITEHWLHWKTLEWIAVIRWTDGFHGGAAVTDVHPVALTCTNFHRYFRQSEVVSQELIIASLVWHSATDMQDWRSYVWRWHAKPASTFFFSIFSLLSFAFFGISSHRSTVFSYTGTVFLHKHKGGCVANRCHHHKDCTVSSCW